MAPPYAFFRNDPPRRPVLLRGRSRDLPWSAKSWSRRYLAPPHPSRYGRSRNWQPDMRGT